MRSKMQFGVTCPYCLKSTDYAKDDSRTYSRRFQVCVRCPKCSREHVFPSSLQHLGTELGEGE